MDWGKAYDKVSPALPNVWESLAILAGVFVLLWLTLRLRAWFREDDADDGSAFTLLSELRELREQGGLTEEEYRSIKTRLAQAAAGTGASRTKPPMTHRPPATAAAETAATAPVAISLHGCSDPPDQDPIGPPATDAADEGPGRATS